MSDRSFTNHSSVSDCLGISKSTDIIVFISFWNSSQLIASQKKSSHISTGIRQLNYNWLALNISGIISLQYPWTAGQHRIVLQLLALLACFWLASIDSTSFERYFMNFLLCDSNCDKKYQTISKVLFCWKYNKWFRFDYIIISKTYWAHHNAEARRYCSFRTINSIQNPKYDSLITLQ